MFEIGSVKNASQFTRSLLNVADYMQMKYNNEVGEAIQTLMKHVFKYTAMYIGKKEMNKERNKVDEDLMEVFMWRKWWEKTNKIEKSITNIKNCTSTGGQTMLASTQGIAGRNERL